MIGTIKKVIVIKGVGNFTSLRAVLRLEQTAFSVKAEININDEYLSNQDFSIAVYDGKQFFCGKNNHDFDKLNLNCVGVSAGLVANNSIIGFGANGNSPASIIEMQELLDNSIYFKTKEVDEELQNIYDDEKISEVNYYDQQFQNSTKKQANQYVQADELREKSKENSTTGNQAVKDETVLGICQGDAEHYSKIRASLTSLFCRGKKFAELERVIPQSKWVKIDYTANQFYVVGIIEENGEPQYICYGVPGDYGSPPEKLKDFSCFVPKSLINVSFGGYYMFFQNAKNGEKIFPKIDIFGY